MDRSRLWRYALTAGILYAASDELHQYFVPGRACQLRDVVIDGLGVLIGVLAGYLFSVTKNICNRYQSMG